MNVTPPNAPVPSTQDSPASAPTAQRDSARAWATEDEARKLLHELQVHQVELAQQNEELQAARSDLAASLQRYIDLYEAAPVGLVTVDRRGIVREINRRGHELLVGGHVKRLVGRSVLDFVVEASSNTLWRAIAIPDTPPAERGVEVKVWSSEVSSRVLFVDVRVHPNEDDSVLLALTDVTARHRAEADLAASEQRFRDLTALSSDWYWEQDQHFRFVAISGAVGRYVGIPPEAHVGKTRWEMDSVDMDSAWTAHREQLERHEPFKDFQVSRLDADGSVRTQSVSGTPIFDSEGRFTGYRGVGRDVTALLQNEALRIDKERAELKSAAKTEFISRMSHELRTPLSAVLGFSRLLAANPALRVVPQATEQLQHITMAGKHLLDMVNDLLDVARVEQGKLALVSEPIDVRRAVDDSMALIAPQATELGLSIGVRETSSANFIDGDGKALRQVLVNVLSNAVKYNRRGGSVTVTIDGDQTRVRIAVRDTGRGLGAEQLGNLFEPFNRLGAEASNTEGSGLGLVVVKSLTQAMHGTVQFESEKDRGTVVTLDFPRGAADARGPSTPEPDTNSDAPLPVAASGRTAPFKVLYIEDNASNVALMQQLLALRASISLEVAADGPAGLALARRLSPRPDLILVDIDLPVLDGYSVLSHLQADPVLRDTACVAISASATARDREKALHAGFVEFVAKPIDIDKFLIGLDQRLARAVRR